jgi:hypothetical protein
MKSLEWKNSDGEEVYTTSVTNIEYVEFEHFPKKFEQVSLENQNSLLEKDVENNPSSLEKS